MTLAEALARFDRKERNWLVRDALGDGARKLAPDFGARVSKAVKPREPDFQLDENAWWAVDYHVDWIVAALHILRYGVPDPKQAQLNDPATVKGHHQDVDLVIASGTTLILVEAKGVGSWSGNGLEDKAERLKALTPSVIESDGRAGPIRVHFVLCSPKKPPSLKLDLPHWAKHDDGQPPWMRLWEPSEPLFKVERCNAEAGRDENGGHWRIL